MYVPPYTWGKLLETLFKLMMFCTIMVSKKNKKTKNKKT